SHGVERVAKGFLGPDRYVTVAMPQSLCIVSGGAVRADGEPAAHGVHVRHTMLAFFRFLAGTFLLIAVIAAVYDGTRSLGVGGLAMTSLIEHWSRLSPALLNAA